VAGTVSVGFGVTALHFPNESVLTLRALLAVYALVNAVAAMTIGERMHETPEPEAHAA
jgi:uncharacterized membrane protein HdeD (DUF308 family)